MKKMMEDDKQLIHVYKHIHVTSLLFKQRIGRGGSIPPNFLMHVFIENLV